MLKCLNVLNKYDFFYSQPIKAKKRKVIPQSSSDDDSQLPIPVLSSFPDTPRGIYRILFFLDYNLLFFHQAKDVKEIGVQCNLLTSNDKSNLLLV